MAFVERYATDVELFFPLMSALPLIILKVSNKCSYISFLTSLKMTSFRNYDGTLIISLYKKKHLTLKAWYFF